MLVLLFSVSQRLDREDECKYGSTSAGKIPQLRKLAHADTLDSRWDATHKSSHNWSQINTLLICCILSVEIVVKFH